MSHRISDILLFRLGSRSGPKRPAEVTMRLQSVDQLFHAPPGLHFVASGVEGASFMTTGRLVSGMEELILELTPKRVQEGVRLTLLLPADEIDADTHGALLETISVYCQLRLRQTKLELEAQQREGLGALRIGAVLFLIGVAISFVLTRDYVPDTVQAVFGNGVFLLIAWLGLWYPLDLLVFYRRPLLRRQHVLRALGSPDLRLAAVEEETTSPFSAAVSGWPME